MSFRQVEQHAADFLFGAPKGTSTATPVEIGRNLVVSQRPHDQPVEPALVERIPRAFKKVLAEPDALAARLVVDALIVRAEADLRWLDLCESRLIDQPLIALSGKGNQ